MRGSACSAERSHQRLSPAQEKARRKLPSRSPFRHEPVPPRHFRELAAMPKTQPIANDGKMKRKEYEKELQKLQVELCYIASASERLGSWSVSSDDAKAFGCTRPTSNSVQSCSLLAICLYRLNFYVVPRKLIPKLQAFP
jgi:hypothetical protein